MARTPKQIIDQTHTLAERFYLGMGYQHIREVHGNLYDSQHPTEQLVWNMACIAQEKLTATDPMDALSELEEDEASACHHGELPIIAAPILNLRRSDFEAMHPNARLFNFDNEKLVYWGDGSDKISSQWSTWCACLGMLHLESIENMESCQ